MDFRMHKVAILDMYDGTPNQGMRAIQEILNQYLGVLDYKVFDVRGKNELPSMEYDIFMKPILVRLEWLEKSISFLFVIVFKWWLII